MKQESDIRRKLQYALFEYENQGIPIHNRRLFDRDADVNELEWHLMVLQKRKERQENLTLVQGMIQLGILAADVNTVPESPKQKEETQKLLHHFIMHCANIGLQCLNDKYMSHTVTNPLKGNPIKK